MILALYAILSAAMWYLGNRALITQPLWSAYPARFARFMDCAACTGFWWGVFWALVIGRRFEIDVGPLPALHHGTPLAVGLCMVVLAPIAAGLMQWGLDRVGVVAVDLSSDD